jgi:hypothetical protein
MPTKSHATLVKKPHLYAIIICFTSFYTSWTSWGFEIAANLFSGIGHPYGFCSLTAELVKFLCAMVTIAHRSGTQRNLTSSAVKEQKPYG